MPVWIYIIPVVFIVVIVLVMIPIIKKKAAAVQSLMSESDTFMAEHKHDAVIIQNYSGTINEFSCGSGTFAEFSNTYACTDAGAVQIQLLPYYYDERTSVQYSSNRPVAIAFEAQSGKTYSIVIKPEAEARKLENVVFSSELSDDKMVFKTKFSLLVLDISGTKEAQAIGRK